MKKSPLGVIEYGLALGFVWGVATLLMSIASSFTELSLPFIHLTSNLYGHPLGMLEGFLASIRGFIDGFIGGAFITLIYNRLI